MKSALAAAVTSLIPGRGRQAHKYGAVPDAYEDAEQHIEQRAALDADEATLGILGRHLKHFKSVARRRAIIAMISITGLVLFLFWALGGRTATVTKSCDSVYDGYKCQPALSNYWGQYSPYFSVESDIATDVPKQCHLTFVQVLSRHGARDPTASKTKTYNATIEHIHSTATFYGKGYEFIKNYEYSLGADQLSAFGQQQMINSGMKFFEKYKSLTSHITPFFRSSGQDRVVESAENFTQGFHAARVADKPGFDDSSYPYAIVTISEDTGSNNTLDHGLCTSFEDGFDSTIGDSAQETWKNVFTPAITERLNDNLPGTNLSNADTISLMDLCPFNTVATSSGLISPFCHLFTLDEWHAYDYLQTLGKYYGYGPGNPLGPTQGVGFTNELIARLTAHPVHDHTSTNSTLDSSKDTFPLNATLYADFSHDNDMTAIFSAMGLYKAAASNPLSNTSIQDTTQTGGYSAAWTVPFAARAYLEKMACSGEDEELVRVIVNDRVLPLETCGADKLGRCKLSAFVDSLAFARRGGDWDKCFV